MCIILNIITYNLFIKYLFVGIAFVDLYIILYLCLSSFFHLSAFILFSSHKKYAMKNLSLFVAATFLCLQLSLAQSFIPFQGIARDSSGVILENQSINLRISIRDSIATGPVVYQETQTVTTNTLGLFTLNIGSGSSGSYSFASINWGHNSKFVQLELNPSGAIYISIGTSQLQSVPYALYALSGGSSSGGSQPVGQIPYGNGRGLISDPLFTRDSATGEVDLLISPSGQGGTYFKADSDGVLIIHQTSSQDRMAMFGVGNPHNMVPQLDTLMVMAGIVDNDSNVIYGFYAHSDSTELITNDPSFGATHGNYGLVGCSKYSSYLDASYNNGNSLNSLTVDAAGVHWQYNSVEQYTLPISDGANGQVLVTNGSGSLSWANSPSAGKSVFTPASGATISAVWGNNIISLSSGISALTITLPSSPSDNETIHFTFTNTITTLSFTGGSIGGAGGLTTVSSVATGNVNYQLTYDAGSSSWY